VGSAESRHNSHQGGVYITLVETLANHHADRVTTAVPGPNHHLGTERNSLCKSMNGSVQLRCDRAPCL